MPRSESSRNVSARTTSKGGIQRADWWRDRHQAGKSDNTGLTATGQRAVPHSGVPATTEPDPGSRSAWPEVLAAGLLLVVFGHVAADGLSTACVSMAWLYATFRGSRGRARQQRIASRDPAVTDRRVKSLTGVQRLLCDAAL